MPSRTHTAGVPKAFIYPVMDHWLESEGIRQIQNADLSVHSQTRQPPDHLNRRINFTSSIRGGIFSLMGGGVCENSPATCRQAIHRGL